MNEGNYKLIEQGWHHTDTVALAISGGIDSMVLYHQLISDYKDTYQKLILLHVNHGVRHESEEEEKYIRQLGINNGHQVEVEHLSMQSEFSQAEARDLRYLFFAEKCRQHNADVLLTAHHRDDHHETVLYQLLTSRHLHAGLGIKTSNTINGMKVFRPLMKIHKEDIMRYQAVHQVHYFEDATNAEDDYTRNYIRHHILRNIKKSEHLYADSLSQVAEDFDELKAVAAHQASEFIAQSHNDVISRRLLQKQPDIIKVFILHKWLDKLHVRAGRKFIEEIITHISNDIPQSDLYIEDKVIKLRYDDLYMEDICESYIILPDDGYMIEYNGRYSFNGYSIEVDLPEELRPLTVRSRQDGDIMHLPNLGRKKVARILIDEKIPSEERRLIPVIINEDNEIIALGTIYNIIKTSENFRGLNISKETANEFEE